MSTRLCHCATLDSFLYSDMMREHLLGSTLWMLIVIINSVFCPIVNSSGETHSEPHSSTLDRLDLMVLWSSVEEVVGRLQPIFPHLMMRYKTGPIKMDSNYFGISTPQNQTSISQAMHVSFSLTPLLQKEWIDLDFTVSVLLSGHHFIIDKL